MNSLFKVVAILCGVFSLGVNAAFITIDEPGMDTIFAQDSFDGADIDIRVGAAVEYVDEDLLTMDSASKWSLMSNNHFGSATTVNFWFLDSISWCTDTNSNYVGCGDFPGNDFVVESVYADSGYNAELLSHELGHNLGLAHRNDSTNNELMDPIINGGTTLLTSEVETIFENASSLVKLDDLGYYIDIIPVLVVAAATATTAATDVPEPSTMMLLAVGLFAIRIRRLIY
ncbi:MAG: hypothetical protein ACJAUL_003935 [Paraglaciecola sp.]|jgi:hypothetical protein